MQKNVSQMDTWQAAGRTCQILVSPEATGTREVSALHVEFEPGQGTPIHTHDGIELMFVIDGEGVSVENGKEEKIYTNHVVLAPKGVSHGIINGPDRPMRMLCVYVPPLPDAYIKANYKKVAKSVE